MTGQGSYGRVLDAVHKMLRMVRKDCMRPQRNSKAHTRGKVKGATQKCWDDAVSYANLALTYATPADHIVATNHASNTTLQLGRQREELHKLGVKLGKQYACKCNCKRSNCFGARGVC